MNIRKHNAAKITETFEFLSTTDSDSLRLGHKRVLSGFQIAGRDGKVSLTFDERDKQQVIELLKNMAYCLEKTYVSVATMPIGYPEDKELSEQSFADAIIQVSRKVSSEEAKRLAHEVFTNGKWNKAGEDKESVPVVPSTWKVYVDSWGTKTLVESLEKLGCEVIVVDNIAKVLGSIEKGRNAMRKTAQLIKEAGEESK